MIGGGGVDCRRADHGIGVTEANEASFVHKFDFGNQLSTENPPSSSYSLDIWVRQTEAHVEHLYLYLYFGFGFGFQKNISINHFLEIEGNNKS